MGSGTTRHERNTVGSTCPCAQRRSSPAKPASRGAPETATDPLRPEPRGMRIPANWSSKSPRAEAAHNSLVSALMSEITQAE